MCPNSSMHDIEDRLLRDEVVGCEPAEPDSASGIQRNGVGWHVSMITQHQQFGNA